MMKAEKQPNQWINFWLDDLRPAPDGFIWAKSVDELIILLARYETSGATFNILSLDHDLGENVATGYDFTKWLVEEWHNGSPMIPRQIYLHTANPVGRENMYQLLSHYKPETTKLFKGPMPAND